MFLATSRSWQPPSNTYVARCLRTPALTCTSYSPSLQLTYHNRTTNPLSLRAVEEVTDVAIIMGISFKISKLQLAKAVAECPLELVTGGRMHGNLLKPIRDELRNLEGSLPKLHALVVAACSSLSGIRRFLRASPVHNLARVFFVNYNVRQFVN